MSPWTLIDWALLYAAGIAWAAVPFLLLHLIRGRRRRRYAAEEMEKRIAEVRGDIRRGGP